MHLSIYALFEFIEFHLLKATLIALSKYERGNGAKKRECFLVSKVEFNFKISSGTKTLPFDPVFSSWVNVIKNCQSKIFLESQARSFLYLSSLLFSSCQLAMFFCLSNEEI